MGLVARPGRRAAARCRSGPGTGRASRRARRSARAVSPASSACPTAPSIGARQRDQAAAQLVQPVPLDQAWARWALLVQAAREQFAQVQVAGVVLHQQQQPAGLLLAAARGSGSSQMSHADDRLDAAAAAGAVELDGAEQVGQVGDRQRHLAVGARRARRRRRCAGCRRRRSIRCGCAGGRRACGDCRERRRPADGGGPPKILAVPRQFLNLAAYRFVALDDLAERCATRLHRLALRRRTQGHGAAGRGRHQPVRWPAPRSACAAGWRSCAATRASPRSTPRKAGATSRPSSRLRVKVKREIIRMNQPQCARPPAARRRSTPPRWRAGSQPGH